MPRIPYRFLVLPLLAASLSACLGGGDDPSTNPASGYPGVKPQAGDYYVYADMPLTGGAAGTGPTQDSTTWFYGAEDAEGAQTRVNTYSMQDAASRMVWRWAGDQPIGLVSLVSGPVACSFDPPFQGQPAPGAQVGQSFSAESTQTCNFGPGEPPLSASMRVSGQVLAFEPVTTTLGTFMAYKYSVTSTFVQGEATTTSTDVCHTDIIIGRVLRCDSTYTTTLSGQAAPVDSGSERMELVAYSFRGQTPVGAVVRRFAGDWSLAFDAQFGATCPNLRVDGSGAVSGSCEQPGSGSFAVSGAVDAAGAISLTTSTGAQLSGVLSSPLAGSGTWTKSGVAGAWTASHL